MWECPPRDGGVGEIKGVNITPESWKIITDSVQKFNVFMQEQASKTNLHPGINPQDVYDEVIPQLEIRNQNQMRDLEKILDVKLQQKFAGLDSTGLKCCMDGKRSEGRS